MASIIIPAHNEAPVIANALDALTRGAEPGDLDVIVVCNGCTDDTATKARACAYPVQVVETEIASKTHALNLGDRVAQRYPRLYVDADVLLSYEGVRALIRRLETGDVLATAPTAYVDTEKCSWPVRAFYEVYSRLPAASEGIGGSGVYALSQTGRERFSEFPDLISDDGFVRVHFKASERVTLRSVQTRVFAPTSLSELIAIKTRSQIGTYELARAFPHLWTNRGRPNSRTLLSLAVDPRRLLQLAVYGLVKMEARRRAKLFLVSGYVKGKRWDWARDESSRLRRSIL